MVGRQVTMKLKANAATEFLAMVDFGKGISGH